MSRVDTDELATRVDIAVGAQLLALRAGRGLSRRELALSAGLDTDILQCFENGERSPNVRQLHALCTVLGVSVRDFVRRALTGID